MASSLTPFTRFTPTHVGNTSVPISNNGCCVGSPPRTWGILAELIQVDVIWLVHPHARGEYFIFFIVENIDNRFTPTHVGNTALAVVLLWALFLLTYSQGRQAVECFPTVEARFLNPP